MKAVKSVKDLVKFVYINARSVQGKGGMTSEIVTMLMNTETCSRVVLSDRQLTDQPAPSVFNIYLFLLPMLFIAVMFQYVPLQQLVFYYSRIIVPLS